MMRRSRLRLALRDIDSSVGHKVDASTRQKMRTLRQHELINDSMLRSNFETFALRCLSMQSLGSMRFHGKMYRIWLRVATDLLQV